MFEAPREEPGTTEKRFLNSVHLNSGQEREKGTKLFFIFDNPEIRNNAMNMLNHLCEERKKYDDDFRFFNGCIVDKERPDVGLEIGFAKNPKHLQKNFEQILIQQGFIPKEEYETIDEIPVPIEEE